MQDIINDIRRKQRQTPAVGEGRPPQHRPEMLYIGCIDARLDPIDDIGIPKGKALIYRNIAALVRPEPGVPAEMVDGNSALETGQIPESIGIGAALEFFVKHIPHVDGKPKHIVVAGHTDCGGIRACLHKTGVQEDRYLPRYLAALTEVRRLVVEHAAQHPHMDEDAQLLSLEQSAVRQSVANLMSYEVVRSAVEARTLFLHGWVIDTATQGISELDAQSSEFKAMGN